MDKNASVLAPTVKPGSTALVYPPFDIDDVTLRSCLLAMVRTLE